MAGRNSAFHYRAIVISLFIGFNLLPTQCSINTYPKLDIYCEIISGGYNVNFVTRINMISFLLVVERKLRDSYQHDFIFISGRT